MVDMDIEIILQVIGVIFLFLGCIIVAHAVSVSAENMEFPTRIRYASIGFGFLFGGIVLV